MVSGGAVRVSSPDVVAPLAAQMNVQKNGYLYVYISNESPTDVYFDDLVVKHITGHLCYRKTPIIRSGLANAGAQQQSAQPVGEQILVQWYRATYRIRPGNLRCHFIETLIPKPADGGSVTLNRINMLSQSPYGVNGNNPVNFSDPLGDDYFRSGNGMNILWRIRTRRP